MTAKGQEITAIIQYSGAIRAPSPDPKDDNKLRRTSIRHITRVRAREIQIRTRGQLWLTR
ncbi:hypothetical protein M405DRAFT_833206 [Rhizopogon salebrosus TDB-379]|nr:hypothetical protein M405DRAFT_833206 [Rhizopogon salebrosus TDB-379]